MKNLYKKISEAVNTGIQKALVLSDTQDTDISVGWHNKKIDSNVDTAGELKELIDAYAKYKDVSSLNAVFDYISTYGLPEKAEQYYKIGNDLYKLKQIVQKAGMYNPAVSLNWIDTSEIEDMSYLFAYSVTDTRQFTYSANESNKRHEFTGDISKWNVSNVNNMTGMFKGSLFTGDISEWNVSNVTNMQMMFKDNKCFKSDISKWKTPSLINMSNMFENCEVFIDINNWNVSNVRIMKESFKGWKALVPETYEKYDFKTNTLTYTYMSDWDVRKVRTMEGMFQDCFLFTSDLSRWKPVRCENMRQMFMHTCVFNCNINDWPVSRVTNMTGMFYQANAFNSPLDKWDVSSVVYMDNMFRFAHVFLQDISMWDTDSLASNDDMLPRNFPEKYKPVFDAANMKCNFNYINSK